MKKLLFSAIGFFSCLVIEAQDCTTPPSGLTLTDVTSCSARLSWDAVEGVLKYRVKYRTTGGSWSPIVNVGVSTYYTFTNLLSNTSYQFAVNVQCQNGTKSKYKNITGITSICTLPVINDITALSTSSLKINLTASCNFDSIRIQYTHNNLVWKYYATTDINNVVLNGLLSNKLYTIKASTCPLSINNWTSSVTATTQGTTPKPNILWIVLDDSRFDTYGCNFGPSWFKSPNIDRIANEGVNFRSYFVTTSFCTPSRSSMVTGLYGHNNGAIDNSSEIYDSLPTLASLLQDHGYYTGMMGKWIENSPYPVFNFSMFGANNYFNPTYVRQGTAIHPTGHSTAILTDTALAFLHRVPQPFFLWLGYKATHDPKEPQSAYTSKYLNKPMPVPDNTAPYTDNYPSYLYTSSEHQIDPDSIADNYRLYFQLVKGIDDAIGRILDTLEAQGILDSTLVLFTSDNGFLLGEHGLYAKRFAYDPSIRDPLFIRYPAWFPPNSVIDDQMALNIDLLPTALDAAGIQDTSLHFDGISLHDLYTGAKVRKEFMYECLGDPSTGGLPTILAVRSFKYKYISSMCQTLVEEFFDLVDDPEENINLINNPQYAATIETFRQKLETYKELYHYNYTSTPKDCYEVNVRQASEDNNEDATFTSLTATPNPSSGIFNLVNPFDEEFTLNIFNSYGISVYDTRVDPGINEINMEGSVPGVYHLHLLGVHGKEVEIPLMIVH